jgi:hypothetical protein
MKETSCALAFCAGVALAWGAVGAETLQPPPPCLSHIYRDTSRATIECVTGSQTLPNPAYTPGAAYYTDRTQACAFDRSTPRLYGVPYLRVALSVYRLYGIPYAQHGQYELDHLIPRCLGGADKVENLWPQPLEEARAKDAVEARICRAVCNAGTMTIDDGQSFFRDLKWAGD